MRAPASFPPNHRTVVFRMLTASSSPAIVVRCDDEESQKVLRKAFPEDFEEKAEEARDDWSSKIMYHWQAAGLASSCNAQALSDLPESSNCLAVGVPEPKPPPPTLPLCFLAVCPQATEPAEAVEAEAGEQPPAPPSDAAASAQLGKPLRWEAPLSLTTFSIRTPTLLLCL